MRRSFLTVLSVCLFFLLPWSATAQTFSNSSSITIADNTTATPYPSNITVSGLTAPVAKVKVTLNGFTHAFPADVDMMLVAPTGAKFVMFSDVGAGGPVSNLTITLDDTAIPLLFAGTLTSGSFRPSNIGFGDPFAPPAPAPGAGDHATPAGTATFASQFNGINGNGTWSLYIVDDTAGNVGSISGGWSLTITQATTATAGKLLIGEFRLRGPGGASDEYIEINNASGVTHTVFAASGTGYGVAASDGVTRCSIPNNTIIPPGGHYLCVNSSAYSLGSYPAGNGTTATGDASYTTDIPDNAGIALFNNNTGGGSYTILNRIDAVGSTAEANSLYKEGAGYPMLTPFNSNYSFTRRPAGGCTGASGNCTTALQFQTTLPVSTTKLVDTHDNASDFIFVETNGTSVGAGQRLGAPGPENLSSPSVHDGFPQIQTDRLDSCGMSQAAPNRFRDLTSDPAHNSTYGTVDIRRTVYNGSGFPITRLRFRVVDVSTFNAPSGVADLRPLTSGDITVTVDRAPCGSTSTVTVRGTTLEQPPSQTNGGGYNSSLSVDAVASGTPLLNGATIDVHFLLGVRQKGNARFCVVPETQPGGVGEPYCYIGSTDGVVSYTPGDFDNDQAADVPLFNRSSGAWTVLQSGAAFGSSTTVNNLSLYDSVPVPGDYDGDNRLDVAFYTPSTGAWLVWTSSTNFQSGFLTTWGGAGYRAVPGDYDGDGQTDIAVYNASTGQWSILLSSTNYFDSLAKNWGGSIFTPIGGLDFDGDRKSDLTIYDEAVGTWYVLKSSTGFATAIVRSWGGPGYTLVPGDYDSDGMADFGLYNRRTGTWSVLLSGSGYTTTLSVTWGGPGFLPMPGDYDGDGKLDLGLYQLQTTTFMALKSSSSYTTSIVRTFGTTSDAPISSAVVPRSSREIDEGDFDGDFVSDITVYNSTSGLWSVLKSSGSFATASNVSWGGAGYTPVPGDYDGDGRFDLGLYQGSTGNWLVLLSHSNFTTSLTKGAGGPGYIPVPGDYDGDGKTDLVVYNPTTGLWYGLKSSTNYTTTISVSWGGAGYTAVPGDFDGDGRMDLGLYQGSTGNWLILTSSSNYTSSIIRNFGGSGYVPVQADFDGDGITDFAVYQTSTGVWTALQSSSGNTLGFTVPYGGAGYTPVAGDWDGDGCADVAVYDTAGNWSILLSHTNYTASLSKNWGGAGYTPLPGFP